MLAHIAKVRWLLGVGMVAAAWFYLAPTSLGGPVSFAVPDGTSMEPRLQRGELVILRASGDYEVGDVAAYRGKTLGRIVLHRIVATDGDRYIFKGDNNDWRDPERVPEQALIGKQWLAIPAGGVHALLIEDPRRMALVVALVGFVAAGGLGALWKDEEVSAQA